MPNPRLIFLHLQTIVFISPYTLLVTLSNIHVDLYCIVSYVLLLSNALKVLVVITANDAIADAGGQMVFVGSFRNVMEPNLPAVHFVSSIVMGVSWMMG